MNLLRAEGGILISNKQTEPCNVKSWVNATLDYQRRQIGFSELVC